jgi:hypothetical protein
MQFLQALREDLPVGAIEGPKIIMSECVRCDDCERLYMDQQKCPHWIIIRRKSELMARQSAAPQS